MLKADKHGAKSAALSIPVSTRSASFAAAARRPNRRSKTTDKQYAKRDAAAEAYVLYSRSTGPREVGLERAAFNAGWEARKRAEYDTMIERVADHVHTSRENRQ